MADTPKITVPTDKDGRLKIPTSERPTGNAPIGQSLPDIADLVRLDDSELLEILQNFGVTDPWSQLVADNYGYATEMSKISNIGTPYYIDREVRRLLDPRSKRGLLNLARETQRAYIMDAYAKEGSNQEFIRISEDDEHTCDRCDGLAGIIGTMGEHISIGLPGAASCDGGSACRCVLALVDSE